MSTFRTDRNFNPTAFTTDVAREAGLVLDVDYVPGDPFPTPSNLITAKLVGDPIAITIRVIDKLGYTTKSGVSRWGYINLSHALWGALSPEQKKQVIGIQYTFEGGTEMEGLFK